METASGVTTENVVTSIVLSSLTTRQHKVNTPGYTALCGNKQVWQIAAILNYYLEKRNKIEGVCVHLCVCL